MTMELIQTIDKLRDIPRGTLLMAEPADGNRYYKVRSSLPYLNGQLIHISHFLVIGRITTPEEDIISGIKRIYEKWSDEQPTENHEAEKVDLATRIYRYVKDELERQNARSG